MSDALAELKEYKFICPESIEISEYIQSILASKPAAADDEPLVSFAVSVPFYTESLWMGAAEHSQEKLIQPILTNIKNYFFDVEDLVPDHNGAIGLLDDTYMVYCFITQLNTHWLEQTGEPFVKINLEPLMQQMAMILGEDNAQQIETHVKSTIDSNMLATKLKTAGKYLLGGLAAMYLVSKLTTSNKQSEDEQWMQLVSNRIYNG